jgi:hypothetical protein
MPAGPGRALVDVPTEQLKSLFRAQVRGELRCPLEAWEIARFGLQSWQGELLEALRGLDDAGVRAVLVAVLAERAARATPG